jgi:23S rRNA (pseudouridine1915-N3)-methyltransferase
MKIALIAVGRLRTGPVKALFDEYVGRLAWPVSVIEVEEPMPAAGRSGAGREDRRLLAHLETLSRGRAALAVVALDEHGAMLGSAEFAARLAGWRDRGALPAFVVGGADGLARPVLDRAELVLSLGHMTWPHLLVRALLAEQLYRAQSILAGHPYHRA